MVVAAVIVAPSGGISPLMQFGGLSLLKRAVLTAQKMGAQTCHIAIPEASAALRQEIENDPRVTCRVVWGFAEPPCDNISDTSAQEVQWLVYPVDALFRHPLTQHLLVLEREQTGQSFVVLDREGEPSLLAVTGKLAACLWSELAQGRSFSEVSQLLQNLLRRREYSSS